jgi:hypothetical protein
LIIIRQKELKIKIHFCWLAVLAMKLLKDSANNNICSGDDSFEGDERADIPAVGEQLHPVAGAAKVNVG